MVSSGNHNKEPRKGRVVAVQVRVMILIQLLGHLHFQITDLTSSQDKSVEEAFGAETEGGVQHLLKAQRFLSFAVDLQLQRHGIHIHPVQVFNVPVHCCHVHCVFYVCINACTYAHVRMHIFSNIVRSVSLTIQMPVQAVRVRSQH